MPLTADNVFIIVESMILVWCMALALCKWLKC
jgi:hypothetical protein